VANIVEDDHVNDNDYNIDDSVNDNNDDNEDGKEGCDDSRKECPDCFPNLCLAPTVWIVKLCINRRMSHDFGVNLDFDVGEFERTFSGLTRRLYRHCRPWCRNKD